MSFRLAKSKSQYEASEVNEISLETVVDKSEKNITRLGYVFTGVISRTLFFNEESSQFYILNPRNENERIFVNQSIVSIDKNDIGHRFLVSFDNNDLYKPIITGRIQEISSPIQDHCSDKVKKPDQVVKDDREKVTISAEKEMVLRCGESSITLTKAGKVLLRGKYILSRSDGVNKIKGGSVQLN